MNKIILILCIHVLLNSCNTKGIHNHDIIVTAEITDKISAPNDREISNIFYLIKINIVNNTGSIVRFRLMSCSWDYNMVFNTDKVLFWHTCDKNIPQILQLMPNEKKSFTGKIKGLNFLTFNEQKILKVGFILIKENEIASSMDLLDLIWEKRRKKKDIIWCNNPIFIDKWINE